MTTDSPRTHISVPLSARRGRTVAYDDLEGTRHFEEYDTERDARPAFVAYLASDEVSNVELIK